MKMYDRSIERTSCVPLRVAFPGVFPETDVRSCALAQHAGPGGRTFIQHIIQEPPWKLCLSFFFRSSDIRSSY